MLRLLTLLGALCVAACGSDSSGASEPDASAPPEDAPAEAAQEDAADDLDAGEGDSGGPASCDSGGSVTCEGAECTVEQALGGFLVRWRLADGTFEVEDSAQQAVVMRGGGAVRTGVGEPALQNDFGAWKIALEGEGGLTWTATEGAASLCWEGEGAWRLRLAEDEVAVRFAEHEGGDLAIEVLAPAADAAEISWACDPGDAFFGLGTQAVGMDLRGRRYPLWSQEQGVGKPEDGGIFPLNMPPEAAYAPMGVWHATSGLSAIVGHDGYHELDLCKTASDRVALVSYRALPSLVLVSGADVRARLARVTEYVGRLAERPDDWVFGPWNDAVGGPDKVLALAATLRDNDIPSSAIWAEDWIGGKDTMFGFRLTYSWAWDQERYPSLPVDIEYLHGQGFAFLAYFNPFVPVTVPMWAEGVEGGYLIGDPSSDGPYELIDPAFRTASLVDLTNPEARAWLAGYQKTATHDLGIDGWMADFSEWLPVDAVLASGEDGWMVHNRYPLDWQRASRDALAAAEPTDGLGGVFFARAGWASVNGGTPGIAPVMWGGDQNTNWSYGDGYPTVVPISTHVGLAGVALFGSDIAGYASVGEVPHTSKELYLRWSSMAAFHAVMRTHGGAGKCKNWNFEADAESLAHYRRYASVHTRLFPLFRGLVDEALEAGLPVVRHPFLVESGTPALWTGDHYQFFVGDDLLVAPVLVEGGTSRPVTLPGEGWWPLFGDAPLDTSALEADAVATEIPAYVRPGTALPLLPRVVDTFYPTDSDQLDRLVDVGSELALALYPEGGGIPETTVRGALGEALTVSAQGLSAEPGLIVLDLPAGPSEHAFAGGTLTLDSAVPRRVHVGLAGAAWGELAAPTPLRDLKPGVQPPCREPGG